MRNPPLQARLDERTWWITPPANPPYELISLARFSVSLSVIYLHPQSTTIDFITVKTCIAVASRNGARTGVDQIVAADPRAVALRQRDRLLPGRRRDFARLGLKPYVELRFQAAFTP